VKAAVLNATNGHFDVEDIQIDAPRGREVLVDVKAAGLCHSDLHIAMASHTAVPAVMGHEVAGIVRAVGPDVTEFAVGDHVVGSLMQYCGECEPCREGDTHCCRNPAKTEREPGEPPRLTRNGEPVRQHYAVGGFAEQILIHEHQLAAIPVEVPFAQAAILGCGCVTGAGAVINTVQVRAGEAVAVIGAGGVGLNAIAGAKLVGAETIIAIDNQADKRELATKFGATHFIDSSTQDVVAETRKIMPYGVDHAFEVVGLEQTVRQALDITRVGGSVNIIGLFRPGGQLHLDANMDMLRTQRVLRGIVMGSARIKRDIPMLARLYLQGRFNLDDLVSRRINISEINEAYADLNGRVARSVITSF